MTDIAKKVNADEPRFVIQNWMRNKDTIEYLGFTMSPTKWINSVNAIGIISKSGKYEGGTYAHFDIAMEFAKNNLIPEEVTQRQINRIYADEADIINVALFGITAKEWREQNLDKQGNIRDYANVAELVCLVNLENLNSVYINEGISQGDRLVKLNSIAIHQMTLLTSDTRIKKLEDITKDNRLYLEI